MHDSNRKPLVAANWKMNKTIGPAIDLAAEVKRKLSDCQDVGIVLAPPNTALKPVGDLLRFSNIKLGAQNMFWETEGAYTGEVGPPILRDLGCEFVILGHSERRTHLGETDAMVNRKARLAVEHQLQPIVCVGETLEQRQQGRAEEIVREQVQASLDGLGPSLADVVVAYEPVWAIGTGETATPDQVQAAHFFIRKRLGEMADDAAAQQVRILYGGSVKPANARDIFSQVDVDGGLIGGASLDSDSFTQIVFAAV